MLTAPQQPIDCETIRGVTPDEHFSNLALLRFAHDIATHYRLEPLAAVDVLCTTPQSFLDLARDPVGLTALASMIAGQLGTEVAEPFMVTVH
jgi:hypothetical protein